MHPLVSVFSDLSPRPALAAGRLAEAGVPVFACVPGGKRPLPGGRGFLDASTELARVESWWRQVPKANLAVPTGRMSGVVAVDVDVHGTSGFDAFRRARDVGLLPRPLAVVRTPSGGMHLYYPADPGMEQRSWQAARAGIDFRGDGGYIVAPPSRVRIDGVLRAYEVVELHADAVESVDAARLRGFLDPQPVAWRNVLRPVLSDAVRVGRIASWVGTLVEGERNRGLFWAACRLAEHGLAPADAFDALRSPAQGVGLSEREVAVTVRSAYRTTQPAPASTAAASSVGSFVRRDPQHASPARRLP
ncbi:bifunctional DNA primase/polymerase [Bifidobacterium psychraerophilum]|uniref:DNA primase/polymerase-like protein n=1 Tax=Bifidobacterium psychraerophilum TaxID=218140 RepID=A0A087CF76_9BIFI|nr:bifunctional DNA primase/polymerase [Bifidobacterium psychraerophilum]KFI81926.1 DNA primase/polymerase-like protein [Bifidobacterium psychraerophilum]PKA94732.1 primase-like protein [Bifidobacterium psychraerophilum DSM 22366]